MKKLLSVFILIPITFLNVLAATDYAAIEAADRFFVKMQHKEICSLWSMLTEESQRVIAKDIIKADNGENDLTNEVVLNDFENCGEITQSYWNAYLSAFDPNTVVNDAAWSIKEASDKNVDISLMYKTSTKPAILHMYFENAKWKVGLVESFWIRKFFD
ncbi:MAG: hypothetical protein C0602_10590 [Denitrovibrio sp.]|nr:MAG: hypothetical protein C0602_10590 [Denitrovibrio sp.]